MNREREGGSERESRAALATEWHITVRSLKMHFTWLKLFPEVKIRHATHWDRDACYSLDRIYLDPKTKAGRHIQCYRLYSVRGGGMSLCVTSLLSFLSPFPHHTHNIPCF